MLPLFLVLFKAYHAGLNSKLRSSVLDDWISSKIQVVVATVAFGCVPTVSTLCITFCMMVIKKFLLQLYLSTRLHVSHETRVSLLDNSELNLTRVSSFN